MKAKCLCGFEFFAGPVAGEVLCPKCHTDVTAMLAQPEIICFEDYGSILDEALEKIKGDVISGKLRHSIDKHSDWSEYSPEQVFEAIAGEFDEYREAYLAENIRGRHGQIDELMDLMVTAIKGIRRLKCLQ